MSVGAVVSAAVAALIPALLVPLAYLLLIKPIRRWMAARRTAKEAARIDALLRESRRP